MNIKRFKELQKEGKVKPPGVAAFKRWDGKKPPYSAEQPTAALAPELEKLFRANRKAKPIGLASISCTPPALT